METLKSLGFTFALEERDDGSHTVKVVDLWYNRPEPGVTAKEALTIRLRPYATYTEAREIANFINSKIFYEQVPLLELC